MKYIAFLFLLFPLSLIAQSRHYPIIFTHFPYSVDGKKWGYCDAEQQPHISMRYDSASFFRLVGTNVIAIVGKDKKYGLIDTTNNLLMPMIYDEIQFCDENYIVRQGKKRWFADIKGEKISEVHDTPSCFIQHPAWHCGGVEIPIEPFSLNSPVSLYYQDKQRFEKWSSEFKQTIYIPDTMGEAYPNPMVFILNKNMNTLDIDTLYRINLFLQRYEHERFEKEFEWCKFQYGPSEKKEIIKLNNKFALKLSQLLEVETDTSNNFKTFIFGTHQTLFGYDSIKRIEYGIYWVKKEDKVGFIDVKGKTIIPIEKYDFLDTAIRDMGSDALPSLIFKKNDLFGLYYYNNMDVNRYLIPPRYSYLRYDNWYIRVTLPNGMAGYLVATPRIKRRKRSSGIVRYREMFPNGQDFN